MKLDVSGARVVIVGFSLAVTGSILLFLVLAPALGMPFNPGKDENIRLVEIIIPVFLGYLGSATHFVTRSATTVAEVADERLLAMLIYGPFAIFTVMTVALFSAFYLYNKTSGPGMTIDDLCKWFSISLGVLTCTVSLISSFVFGGSSSQRER